MCGIVGYVGPKQAAKVLLAGLERLEYRGYDSAGLSVWKKDGIATLKKKGEVSVLGQELDASPENYASSLGIAHTRWATHGAANDVNAHPHESPNGHFSVVHNGIIENHQALRDSLREKGHSFLSETDSEVIAHLLQDNESTDIKDTLRKTLSQLEGSFALCILSKENEGVLYAVRSGSPLIVGLCKEGYVVASDVSAILDHTSEVLILEDKRVAILNQASYALLDFSMLQTQQVTQSLNLDLDLKNREKGAFPHYMLKEIFDAPCVLQKTYVNFVRHTKVPKLEKSIDKIVIIACGTANHAGQLARYSIESLLGIPVTVDVASEFRHMDPLVDKGTLALVVSQSGETADTLGAAKEAQKRGAYLLGVTNVRGSSLTHLCDASLYTHAGPEISVASTKAYVTQILLLRLLVLSWAKQRNAIDPGIHKQELIEMKQLPEKVGLILQRREQIASMAQNIYEKDYAFFMGRNQDYLSALEGALKLKEVSYMHAQAYPAGELKHGTLALITQDTPVISLVTRKRTASKMQANIEEVRSRGADVYSVVRRELLPVSYDPSHVFVLPPSSEELSIILTSIVLQILAYEVAVLRGCSIDKPRNLAKSVTVE